MSKQYSLKAVTITKERDLPLDIDNQVKGKSVILSKLTKDAWFIGSDDEEKLKEKIEHIGKPLKDWDVKIYRGVLTGLNEAFIIDDIKRQEILDNCKDEDERIRTEAIIKPILRGRDIKRYYYKWAGLWVIGTFPALHLNIDDYPAIKKYLLDHFDIKQLEQSGKKYPELGFNARKKTGNKWFETQDQIAYYSEFEKEKVVWNRIANKVIFSYVTDKFFVLDSTFFIVGKKIKFLTAVLNSKVALYWMKSSLATLGEGMYGAKIYVEKIPIPPITPSNQPIVSQIESLVDKILAAKKTNHAEDTTALEKEIDQLVYQLYELTDKEIRIIEGVNEVNI
jgi:type II restriction/modification system DNA methylase subunit YeeA